MNEGVKRHCERVAKYREQGIELLGLWRPGLRYIPRHLLESYEVYRILRDRHFDVVHFHDYQGAGYYSLLAKTQGLAMHETVTVIGLHGVGAVVGCKQSKPNALVVDPSS